MKTNHGLLCLCDSAFHPQLCQGSAIWSELLQIVRNGLSPLNIWRRQIKCKGFQCTSNVYLIYLFDGFVWEVVLGRFGLFWALCCFLYFFLGDAKAMQSISAYLLITMQLHRLSSCSHLLCSCLPPRATAQSIPILVGLLLRENWTASGSWPTVAPGRCSLQRFGQSQQHLAAGVCDPDMCVAMKGSPATQLE